MTMQPPPYPPQVPTPPGVLAGTAALRAAQGGRLTPEDVRRLSNSEHDDLQQADYSGENGYRDPVDPGDNPWDVFSRTQIESYDEAKTFACNIAMQIPRLRRDPRWQEAPWINMPIMSAAYHIEMVLRKSIGRLSLIEALMSRVGMFSPDTFMDLAKSSKRRSS